MSEPTRRQLLRMVERIEADCKLLREMVNEIKPKKQWLSTTEFAEKSGLALKTVSTYCGQGKFARVRKNGKGRWEIHKSELDT